MKDQSNQELNINWSNPHSDEKAGIHVACLEGHREIVEYIITLPQINVNQRDWSDQTPLFIACWKGDEEIVKILSRDDRVDLNQKNEFGKSPLWLACERRS